MITEKQKLFILDNIDILSDIELQEIIEHLIDKMDKKYATELIGNMIDYLSEIDYSPEALDYGDR